MFLPMKFVIVMGDEIMVRMEKIGSVRRRSNMRITGNGRSKSKKNNRRCWHCNEKGHVTGDCPNAIAGKTSHPKSRFGKSCVKGNKSRGADPDDL